MDKIQDSRFRAKSELCCRYRIMVYRHNYFVYNDLRLRNGKGGEGKGWSGKSISKVCSLFFQQILYDLLSDVIQSLRPPDIQIYLYILLIFTQRFICCCSCTVIQLCVCLRYTQNDSVWRGTNDNNNGVSSSHCKLLKGRPVTSSQAEMIQAGIG